MDESSGQEGARPPAPLEGIRVAVPATRRAAETAALVRRWGGEPLVGPLLEEVPVEDEAPMRAATEEIVAAPATWSVHLTGVGTRRWLARAEAWGLRDPLLAGLAGARIVARGPHTSAVQAANLFAVARTLGLEADLRRCLNERIFTAAVGGVSRSGLEREGVRVDFVAEPARLGALIRGLAASSDRIRAKAGGGREDPL